MSSLGNTFSNIANSIRNVSESSDLYTPLEMSNVINNIITDKEWEQIGWDDDRKNVPWVTLFQKVEGTSNVTKSDSWSNDWIVIFHETPSSDKCSNSGIILFSNTDIGAFILECS